MKQQQLFRWVPRLFTIVVILFIGSFSADSFDTDAPLHEALIATTMHLFPAIILAILLAIAWQREKAGGIVLLTLGLALTPFVFMLNHQRNHFTVYQSLIVVAIINLPVIIAGVLFLVSSGKHASRT
jgi:peptidoglycan/LPS O-acetylase OafA/YrhL